jgi:dTDP-4-amino-4,6-dideoxy-D-galactose acyltransferase
MPDHTACPPELLERLEWDSSHFGFPVARISRPDLSVDQLQGALQSARERGIELLYWSAIPSRVVPDELLRRFSGLLADRKVTFQADPGRLQPVAPANPASEFRIEEYPCSEPAPELLELAVGAGEWSRYRRDPNVPPAKFRSLYEIWMRRSTLRELANTVLVARNGAGPCVGVITIGGDGKLADIGLLAVDSRTRGRGVALALMDAARNWMLAAGVPSAQVVTQLDNEPACKLYVRSGYRQADLRHVHHFWPCKSQS